MFDFFKGVWTFLLAVFSGCGNIICKKIFKKKFKKHNQKTKPRTDKEIILHTIEYGNSPKQKEIFMRYFYKYKSNFSSDDVEDLIQKSEASNPNYCILLNILLGLIESKEQN